MNSFKFYFQATLLLLFVVSFPSFARINDDKIKEDAPSPSVESFSVEKIDIHKERAIVDSLLLKMTLEEEEIANIEEEASYAGFDLYEDNWNNDRVHAYGNVSMPDSLIIDCAKFAFPTFGYVTSKFGPRRRRMHNGIDLKVYKGDSILSAFEGKVRIAKYMRGYGNVVVLRHPNGLETIYGHLSKIKVTIGQDIEVGECIGLGGSTGRSTGTHLHFETRILGRPINPSEIFDFENNVLRSEKYVFYSKKSSYRDPSQASIAYHRVRSGETLGKIAARYRISINELCRINKLRTTSVLRIGQVIRLDNDTYVAQNNVRTNTKSNGNGATAQKTRNSETAASTTKTNTRSGVSSTSQHTVQKGETLGKVAARYGTTIADLCEANNLTERSLLSIGQVILLPKGFKKAASNTTPQTTAAKKTIHQSVEGEPVYHSVRSGDTLAKLAARYGTSIEQLCSMNGIKKESTLRLGQKIRCS